jgi:hypothetical protein
MVPRMFKSKRSLNYANVTATLALVFSMSGGALAASHYLINSTKQINPKVLKKLKGNAGANGAPGATGPSGPSGPAGSQGKEGPAGAAGSAVAFAHVLALSEPTAMLDAANSKNVSAVSEGKGEKGLYCITTTVPVKNATGNADFNETKKGPDTVEPDFSLVTLAIALKVCPASTTALAVIDDREGTGDPADFWISFN